MWRYSFSQWQEFLQSTPVDLVKASFTVMYRMHKLASLLGHSILKTADSIEESSIGWEESQNKKLLPFATLKQLSCFQNAVVSCQQSSA